MGDAEELAELGAILRRAGLPFLYVLRVVVWLVRRCAPEKARRDEGWQQRAALVTTVIRERWRG